jgi:hypothetical protein
VKAVSAASWRSKRYGRILGSTVEEHLEMFRTVIAQGEEMRARVGSTDGAKFWEELGKNPTWANFYLQPFVHLLARFAVMSNTAEAITELAKREFPSDHVKDELYSKLDEVEPPDSPLLIPMFLAVLGNMESITRFSCTLDELLVKAAAGDVDALAKAASIDTGVLSLPICQLPLKLLQLTREHSSLRAFLASVAQGPHQGRIPYQELRWVEYLLREQGAFEACTQTDIYELIVDGLKVYGDDSDHRDAKKALFATFRKWRKQLAN